MPMHSSPRTPPAQNASAHPLPTGYPPATRHTRSPIQAVHFDNTPVRAYRRDLDLVRLIPLWPRQIADKSADGTRFIVRRLEKALRSERCRGKAGHWTYSLSRHKALKEALDAERKMLGKAELLENFRHRQQQGTPPLPETD